MSSANPSYEDCLRIFQEEIGEHLHWQEVQEYSGLLTVQSGWKMSAQHIFEHLDKLQDRIPSQRFQNTMSYFFEMYVR
jgi:hypothetical protein